MNSKRILSRSDRVIGVFDDLLRSAAGHGKLPSVRPYPAGEQEIEHLNPAERKESAALMRVNHVGEVCAQALYAGQAAVAASPDVAELMRAAADEELDHLNWCEQRLRELGGRKSLLNPVWGGGSLVIGMLAGISGDKRSLAFIEETEVQVCEHLNGHLQRLPENDLRSRKVLQQMRDDEARHAETARREGAVQLSRFTKLMMKIQAKVMTTIAYKI
ncbi:MAG: 2-polyprenyl-3-methyl-6-methoxy-1,4-benzoquinone monooxygenase [Pseudomonadota bacterium]